VFVGVALMAVVAGRVAAHIGYRAVLGAGGVLWATGALWMAMGMTASPSTTRWLGAICIIGLGSGLLWGSMLAVSLSTLPSGSMAAGASLSQTLQNIGNTLGIAIMVTALGHASVGDLGAFPGAWTACAIITTVAVVVCAWGAGAVRAPAHSPAIASG
jgi:fucose permease